MRPYIVSRRRWFTFARLVNASQPVVLVDDNHDDLFILKRLLSRAGLKNAFISFDDARACTSFLQSAIRTPDTNLIPAAIFSDKAMPDFNGFDLLQWVRQQPPLGKLPFILLTSTAEPGDEKRAEKLGVTAFFEKFPSQHVFMDMFGQ